MAGLTRDVAATITTRVGRDPRFRDALLAEAVDCLISGEVVVGTTLLRNVVEATIGFGDLARSLGVSPRSLERMLAPAGQPTAARLLAVVDALQEAMA